MQKISIVAILFCALSAGCGDVVVFGHKVHERSAPPESGSDAPAPVPAAPAAATTPPPANPPSNPPASAPAPAPSVTAAATAAPPVSPASSPPVLAPAPAPTVAPAAMAAPPVGPPVTPPVVAPAPKAQVVTAVSVSVTPAATGKVQGNASFGTDALASAVRSELTTRKLLNARAADAAGTLQIAIEDLSTHPSSNAVLFGYQPMAGSLTGTIRVADPGGNERAKFRIVAEARWNVSATADDKNPLKSLYRRFAVLTADRLAGVASGDDSSPDWSAR